MNVVQGDIADSAVTARATVASLIGSPGQSMYAAANTFLDDLADWRAAPGLPATAIHWGAWARTGRGQHLADRGFVMMSPEDGTDALGRILTAGHTRVAYSPIEAGAYAKGFPAVAASELLAELGRAGEDHDSALLDEVLAAETDARRTSLIQEHIITLTRQILGAVRLRAQLEKRNADGPPSRRQAVARRREGQTRVTSNVQPLSRMIRSLSTQPCSLHWSKGTAVWKSPPPKAM
ncbi:KR domain-containing protein [Nonomuraea sp. NPDC001699]